MNNIDDLHLATEVVPLFDYTRNDSAKETLLKIFLKPLTSIAEIGIRQDIIKGFIGNLDFLKDYTYARPEFNEVHAFLNDTSIQQYGKEFRLKLLFLARERHRTLPKFVQFVLLFHRLHSHYIGRMNREVFPDVYKKELVALFDFLATLRLDFYDKVIREDAFKVKHVIELAVIISSEQLKGTISVFYERLALFEAYLSIARAVTELGFCFPTFSESHFRLVQVYHPLLKNPVKNTFSNRSNLLLLTGPNMSGKSTFLKSVALCVYLAHIGVGVPAAKAELPYFEHISVSINHNDDLLHGYSHFMAEIMRLKQVLVEANKHKKCFAIFDELFKGTNIEDAVQISSSTVAGLSRFSDSFFFISTHLHQLQELEQVKQKQADCYYLDCVVNNNRPVFNYELKEGWSSLKVGQLLFEQEGLNELLQPGLNGRN